tara:strand:- start:111 stop:236 length:126 start_codon:yes stop_codon:yes gene_type:complete
MNYKKAWNKLYEYHNNDENNDTQHDWEMREVMDRIMKEVNE